MALRPASRYARRKRQVLSVDEVRKILKAADGYFPHNKKTRAMIAVMYRCGLRVGEMLDLDMDDLDFKNHYIHVHYGKSGERMVGMDPWVEQVIQEWLVRRKNLKGVTESSPVFCRAVPPCGSPTKQQAIRLAISKLGKRAKIRKRVYPHVFRHTAAFEMANEGIPIHVIQAMLGHSNIGTTNTYLSHLNPKETIDVMRSRPMSILKRSAFA